MPIKITSKTPEVPKKIETEEFDDAESGIWESIKDSKSDIAPPGEGEPKKIKPRPKKTLHEKKAHSPIVIPKTKAQRAKGSIALNKPVEDTVNQQTSTQYVDIASQARGRDEGTNVVESRKIPVPVRSRGRVRDGHGSTNRALKNAKKMKNWSETEKASKNWQPEKPPEPAETQTPEVKPEEHPVIPPVVNTCSLFERIQQGVRAYFGSKNSFGAATDEKNKKKVPDGGIRTRASVAKEVKEEAKKRNPGVIVKGKINILESRRGNSSLGGQSSKFSRNNPKAFRHFRRPKPKKLQNRKKHYLRVQIPRKRYFCRSEVYHKAPEAAPTLQRLEFSGLRYRNQKIQIPRVASKCPQVSNVFKKELKNPKKGHDHCFVSENSKSLDCLSVEFLGKLNGEDPLCLLQERMLNANIDREFTSEDSKLNKKMKTKIMELKKKPLETSSEGAISTLRWKRLCPFDPSLGRVIQYITSGFNKEDVLKDLEITSVLRKFPFAEYLKEEPLHIKQFLKPERIVLSPMHVSPVTAFTFRSSGNRSDKNVVEALMGDMNLHSEIRHYFKAQKKTKVKKPKKHTLFEEHVPLSLGVNRSCPNAQKSIKESSESDSVSSFESANSITDDEDTDQHSFQYEKKWMSEVRLDLRRRKEFRGRKIISEIEPKRIFLDQKLKSQVKRTLGRTSLEALNIDLSQMSELMQYTNSESQNHLLERNSAIDVYEKIRSLDSEKKKRSKLLFKSTQNSSSSRSMTLSSQYFRKNSSGDPPKSPVKSWILQKEPNQTTWTPDLKQLTEIYECFLRKTENLEKERLENIKNSIKNRWKQSNGKKGVIITFSNRLFLYLCQKVQEVKETALTRKKISESFGKNMTIKLWESLDTTPQNNYVKSYVKAFQNILHSSLSIDQIIRLNKTIRAYEKLTSKHKLTREKYETKKVVFKETKKVMKENKKVVQEPKKVVKETKKPVKGKTVDLELVRQKLLEYKKQSESEKLQLKEVDSTPIVKARVKPKKAKPRKSKPEEEAEKIRITGPTELGQLLRACSKNTGRALFDLKNKAVITVKLDGSEILVNHMAPLKSERNLSRKKTPPRDTTELIIEKVETDKAEEIKKKETKHKTNSKKKSHKKKVKICSEPKVFHLGPDKPDEKLAGQESLPFEYSQEQLRAQHPIDAILESTESERSSRIEDSNDDLPFLDSKEDPSSYAKLLSGYPDNQKNLNDVLRDALAEKVFSKDLIYNFLWNEGELEKTPRVLDPKPTKSRLLKKSNNTRTVKSMSDLEKSGRKCLPDKFESYPTLQDKKSDGEIKEESPSAGSAPKKRKSVVQGASNASVTKTVLEELSLKMPKSDVGTLPRQESGSAVSQAADSGKSSEGLMSKTTRSLASSGRSPDCCGSQSFQREDSRAGERLGSSGGEQCRLREDQEGALASASHPTSDRVFQTMFQEFANPLNNSANFNRWSLMEVQQGKSGPKKQTPAQLTSFKPAQEPIDSAPESDESAAELKNNTKTFLESIKKFIRKPSMSKKNLFENSSDLDVNKSSQKSQVKTDRKMKEKAKEQSREPAEDHGFSYFVNHTIFNLLHIMETYRNHYEDCKNVKKDEEIEEEISECAEEKQFIEKAINTENTYIIVINASTQTEDSETSIVQDEDEKTKEQTDDEFENPAPFQQFRQTKELQMLNTLLVTTANDADLKESDFTSSDSRGVKKECTVDEAPKEKGKGHGEPLSLRGLVDVLNQKRNRRKDEQRESSTTTFKPASPRLLSKSSDEQILSRLIESLQENEVSYALALVDIFLKNAEAPTCRKPTQLSKALTKSKNLTMSLKTSGWLEVFDHLEDLSKMLEVDDPKKALEKAKTFAEKIQNLEVQKLMELKNFYLFLSRPTLRYCGSANAIFKLINFFKFLMYTFFSTISDTVKGRGLTTSSTNIEGISGTGQNPQLLRKKLQHRKAFIDGLLKATRAAVSARAESASFLTRDRRRTLPSTPWGVFSLLISSH